MFAFSALQRRHAGRMLSIPVRTAARKRNAVICLKWSFFAAIRTAPSVPHDQLEPLCCREGRTAAELPHAPAAVARFAHLSVSAVIREILGELRLAMASVIGSSFGLVFVRVCRSPASHRRARFLGVSLHPLAPVGTSPGGIFVCHARSHTGRPTGNQ